MSMFSDTSAGEISLRLRVTGNLLKGVACPDLRLICLDSFGEPAPGLKEMAMDHRDVIAEVERGYQRRDPKMVYWIGGGSAAGKSTISRRLAAEYGLQT